MAQYLLHYLWREGLAQATPSQVEQVAHQLRQERAADLQGWWEAVDDSGQQAYLLLAEADDWLSEQALLSQVQGIKQPLDQGLAALCYHGLVQPDERDQHYRLTGLLFRDWVWQHIAPGAQNNGAIDPPWQPAKDKVKTTIPQELTEQLQKGNLALFLGADLPRTLTALPTRADLAHDYGYRDRRLSLLEQLEDQLADVNKALNRLKKGTYGICTNCGEAIMPERLEALPYAELCINCQRKEGGT